MYTAFTEAIATDREHELEVTAMQHSDQRSFAVERNGFVAEPAVSPGFAAPASARTLAIRLSRQADARQLAGLGRLDGDGALSSKLSAHADGGVLLAETDGEIVAAVALGDDRVAADPFRPSAGAADVLRLRARQLGALRHSRRTHVFAGLRLRVH
jgi:hypothetical protein